MAPAQPIPTPSIPADSATPPAKQRLLGVDVTRGIALLSMLAADIFEVIDGSGGPTLAGMTVTGRSATLFVMVAGISLAFITGGRHPVQGRTRRATAAGLAVRALLIAAIGLTLGYAAPDAFEVILPYYGLFFLLAIPLVGLRPRTLIGIAGALVAVGPLLILGMSSLGWLEPALDGSPRLDHIFTHPISLVLDLFVTGIFPAVVYMAFICTGLAIGRLDLTSTKVATRLLGAGLVLAVTAWVTSSVLLFQLGGLRHLGDAATNPAAGPVAAREEILWDPSRVDSWWWLALRAHHTNTPLYALHTLGVAVAVLGAVLLVTRLRIAQRLLWPIGVAGSMTLTIYSAHVLLLGTDLLSDEPLVLYLVSVAGALAFAVVWRRWVGQGPLEKMVATLSGRARRAVTATANHQDHESQDPHR